ncbi:MAG: cold shock domain-containing protein [Bacteroidota bacterium]
MGRSQQSYSKREKEKKRLKKREEKQKKKEARRAEAKEKDDGIPFAYVDKYGQLSDAPFEPSQKDEDEEVIASEIVIGVPKKEKSEDEGFINNGKVAFFDYKKGFGFITDTKTQEKHFCHISSCIDEISEGDTVTFDLEKGQRGLNAINVVLATRS